jgi:hypothetical protein
MPFCPECRDEFREGFTVCAECGATLVDTLPPEEAEPEPAPETETGGTHGGWDQVFESGTRYEAELVAMRLRSAGFDEVQVVDQSFQLEPMPDVRNFNVVRVLVPTGRAAEARDLIAQPVELPPDAEVAEDGEEK